MEFVVSEPLAEIIGPFREGDWYKLVVDGCQVPYIYLSKNTSPQDEWEAGFEWCLHLDNRFMIFATEEEVMRWSWFLANAMAVSAGFTCHGPTSGPINRHKLRVIGLSSDEAQSLGIDSSE